MSTFYFLLSTFVDVCLTATNGNGPLEFLHNNHHSIDFNDVFYIDHVVGCGIMTFGALVSSVWMKPPTPEAHISSTGSLLSATIVAVVGFPQILLFKSFFCSNQGGCFLWSLRSSRWKSSQSCSCPFRCCNWSTEKDLRWTFYRHDCFWLWYWCLRSEWRHDCVWTSFHRHRHL